MDQATFSNSQFQCKISHRFWICPPSVAKAWENAGKQLIFVGSSLFLLLFCFIFSAGGRKKLRIKILKKTLSATLQETQYKMESRKMEITVLMLLKLWFIRFLYDIINFLNVCQGTLHTPGELHTYFIITMLNKNIIIVKNILSFFHSNIKLIFYLY